MCKQYRNILIIFLSFFLWNTISLATLFDGHPSGSKKCEGGYWPIFNNQEQILNLFDEDWEKITLESKGTRKTFYFNLIGITKPEQASILSHLSENDLHALQNNIDIKLVPYRQDKKDRTHICHYAFRLKGVPDTLVQIARVENVEDQTGYTRNDLLIKGLTRHLNNFSEALKHLGPAIGATISAGIEIGNASNAGMPATPDALQSELDAIKAPATEATSHWADFFNALLGLNDDEDAQI